MRSGSRTFPAMPILPTPDYTMPFPFTNGHVQTLYPTLLRTPPSMSPKPERIDTPDGDFLDVDWHHASGTPDKPAHRAVIVSHGLEGNTRKKYPLGMAAALTRAGWDVVCRNMRGCSGEMNRSMRFYHSGETDDLHTVVTHVLETGHYDEIALVGFSLGGNQTLVYLGKDPARVPRQVRKATVFSVPCDLGGCADMLELPSRRIYMEYFMRGLRQKVRIKDQMFPGELDLTGLSDMISFREFDDRFTGPVHGFIDAEDYYARCSSLQFLHDVQVPTLMVSAANDVFLTPSCYPREQARTNSSLFLEVPRTGGHVGFVQFNGDGMYWSERRAARFLSQ